MQGVKAGCNKLSPEEKGFRNLFLLFRGRAARDGKAWELSKEKFRELVKSPCFYCGGFPSGSLTLHYGRVRQPDYTFIYNGIDRVYNFLGYIEENCVPCCFRCNSLKRDFSASEFEFRTKKVIEGLRRFGCL